MPTPIVEQKYMAKSSKTEDGPPRAVIYARVSTSEQAKDGNAIAGQIEACRSYCILNGIKLVAEPFIDAGYSGGNFNRPAFARLRAFAESKPRPIEKIIVWKLDRIGRSADAIAIDARLSAAGIEIVDITQSFGSGPGSALMKGLSYLVAADARHQISQNVSRGQRQAIASGRHGTGGPRPFGYKVEYLVSDSKPRRHYVPHPDEAPIIKQIFQRFDRQQASIRSITAWLNESLIPTAAVRDGHKARGGTHGLWLHGTVWRILKNEVYTGSIIYGRRSSTKDLDGKFIDRKRPESEHLRVENAHEAIITKTVFERVKARLESNEQAKPQPGKPSHFLVGIGKCARCGGPVQHESNGNYYYYTCRNRRRLKSSRFDACKGTIRADIIQQELFDYFAELYRDQKASKDITKRIEAFNIKAEKSQEPSELEHLNRAIERERRRISNLVAYIAEGGSKAVRAQLTEAEALFDELLTKRNELQNKANSLATGVDPKSVIKNIEKMYAMAQKAQHEAFFSALPQVVAQVILIFNAGDRYDPVTIVPHFDERLLPRLSDDTLSDISLAAESQLFIEWLDDLKSRYNSLQVEDAFSST